MKINRLGFVCLALSMGCKGVIGPDGSSGNVPGNTPGGNTPGGNTPGGNTPGGTTPGGTDPVDATGHYALRRLTNQEYTNTVQDLLFTKQTPGATFQESLPGQSGYTNDSQALDISDELLVSYYGAATSLAKEVVASKGTAGGAYSKLVTCDATKAACAQQTVSTLAKRALRRPLTPADLDAQSGLMAVFSASGTFDQGLYDVIVSLLMHPEFLTIPVVNVASLDPTTVFKLDDYQLAARLSYFLWQSMPDDALTATADQGTLHQPDVLRAQLTRMLSDTRMANLKNVLRDEYAGLSSLAQTDLTQLGQTNALRDAMIGETDAFFADLVTNDRSPLTVLTGTQSFVNKTLADWYGLPFPAGQNPATFVPVTSTRTGLGSHASVLVNSAGGSPTFTNPIKRGHWIANKLLCIEPPPPPPNVPPLPAMSAAAPTVRERLAAHLISATCVTCHTAMDAAGLGAEDYGPFGQWRTTYADSTPIDASGTLPGDNTPFTDSASMFKALGTSDTAKACVALQFMKLAASRDLNSAADQAAATGIAQSGMTGTSHLSDLLWGVINTAQFQQQTGEAP
jgi:hypothetical protein